MNKQDFLDALRDKLSNLPKKDVAEKVSFYSEMIDDKMEEGASEEDAIADIGSVDDIYEQFVKELPLFRIIKDRIKPKRKLSGGKIAIIASTSVIWIPLLIAAISIIISLCAVLWSLVISAWAVLLALALSAPVGIVAGILSIFAGNISHAILLIGAGLICAGLAIFAYFGTLYATGGSITLTKKIVMGIKNLIIR